MSAPLELEGPNEATMQLTGISDPRRAVGQRASNSAGAGAWVSRDRLRAAPLHRSLAVWGVPLRGTVGPKLSVGQMAWILFFKPSHRKGLKNPAQGRGE